MTGPEHYRAAEKCIELAQAAGAAAPGTERAHLAYAQVHATLALAAATAFPRAESPSWTDVAGSPQPEKF